MSSNQHSGHLHLSNETSTSTFRGARVSNNRRPVSDGSLVNSNRNLNQGSVPVAHGSDYQDSRIHSSNTYTPTTRQPPTLPSIAATSGVTLYPGTFILGPPYSWHYENTSAPPAWAQTHIGANWLYLPSSHSSHNLSHRWNDNRAAAPLHPHAVVSATGHPAAAGYHPSTFTSSPVSARNRELMDGSTPLERSGQQSGTSNPLGTVGDYGRAYSRYYVTKFETFTARRRLRISNAQAGEALPVTNEESDSIGVETPSSGDEAELDNSSIRADGPGAEDEDEEQDTGPYEEAVESEERRTNELNADY